MENDVLLITANLLELSNASLKVKVYMTYFLPSRDLWYNNYSALTTRRITQITTPKADFSTSCNWFSVTFLVNLKANLLQLLPSLKLSGISRRKIWIVYLNYWLFRHWKVVYMYPQISLETRPVPICEIKWNYYFCLMNFSFEKLQWFRTF